MRPRDHVSMRRKASTWLLSIAGGAAFLWLASHRIDLWPASLELPHPELLWVAAGVHVPYAIVRAMRLAYVFDPIVAAAAGPGSRIDRRVLYGSGFVSFFVLIVLPFKLGELSRPLLLVKGRQPGVGMAESISGVATERIVDGLIICSMLFGGLALASQTRADALGELADVQHVGRWLLGAFVVAFGMLLGCAYDLDRAAALARRLTARVSDRLAERIVDLTRRFAGAVRALMQTRRALAFVAWSLAYWAITTLQLWLVLRACGLALGAAEASAIVAIVGLSIQLPGGPAQAGTFQLGATLALSLFASEEAIAGAGSSFIAVMYLLQFFGALAMAMPGAALMASGDAPRPPSSTP